MALLTSLLLGPKNKMAFLEAHSQREKQMLLAMLFSTSKYEKSKANVKLAKAKVEVLTLLLHSH